jgi:predicted lysophospholipase L1 biosynthesis ABC-type transport system permease subunit
MAAALADRPRELRWYHAGPMLFGDLGTSRLYVLGLAFHFTQHASLFHIFFVNVLLVLVGCCYLIICVNIPTVAASIPRPAAAAAAWPWWAACRSAPITP